MILPGHSVALVTAVLIHPGLGEGEWLGPGRGTLSCAHTSGARVGHCLPALVNLRRHSKPQPLAQPAPA